MIRRPLLLLAALSAACGSSGVTTGGTPGTRPTIDPVAAPPVVRDLKLQPEAVTHYSLAQLDSLTLVMGGGEQGQVFDRTLFLTVTSEPGTTGRSMTVIVDSLQTREVGLITPFAIDSLRGLRFTGTLAGNGKIGPLTPSRPTLLGTQISRSVRLLLFPLIPPEGAKAGSSWTDSTSDTLQVNAFGGRDHAALRYSAADAERAIGSPVVPISLTRLATIEGATTQNGQTITLSGTDSSQVVFRVASNGHLMAAAGTVTGDMSIVIPSVGQTLPARQRGTFTLTRLP